MYSYEEESGELRYSVTMDSGEQLTACLEHAGTGRLLRMRKCAGGWAQSWAWSQPLT